MLQNFDLKNHNNYIKPAKLYFCRLVCNVDQVRVGLTVSHLIKTNLLIGFCFNREFVI